MREYASNNVLVPDLSDTKTLSWLEHWTAFVVNTDKQPTDPYVYSVL
jgi:hypothetical protein